MTNTGVGVWLGEDGKVRKVEPNLYRYVGNSPTNATDPSGMVAVPTVGNELTAPSGLFSTNCSRRPLRHRRLRRLHAALTSSRSATPRRRGTKMPRRKSTTSARLSSSWR